MIILRPNDRKSKNISGDSLNCPSKSKKPKFPLISLPKKILAREQETHLDFVLAKTLWGDVQGPSGEPNCAGVWLETPPNAR